MCSSSTVRPLDNKRETISVYNSRESFLCFYEKIGKKGKKNDESNAQGSANLKKKKSQEDRLAGDTSRSKAF